MKNRAKCRNKWGKLFFEVRHAVRERDWASVLETYENLLTKYIDLLSDYLEEDRKSMVLFFEEGLGSLYHEFDEPKSKYKSLTEIFNDVLSAEESKAGEYELQRFQSIRYKLSELDNVYRIDYFFDIYQELIK